MSHNPSVRPRYMWSLPDGMHIARASVRRCDRRKVQAQPPHRIMGSCAASHPAAAPAAHAGRVMQLTMHSTVPPARTVGSGRARPSVRRWNGPFGPRPPPGSLSSPGRHRHGGNNRLGQTEVSRVLLLSRLEPADVRGGLRRGAGGFWRAALRPAAFPSRPRTG